MRYGFILLFLLINCRESIYAQSADTILLHFDFNKSALLSKDSITLDSVFGSFKDKFILQRIVLNGHCDSIGNTRYNDSLSNERILGVKEYLLSRHHLPPPLFTQLKPMGKRVPLNDNGSDAKRALNRRVALILYKSPVANEIKVSLKKAAARDSSHPIKGNISTVLRDTATKKGTLITLKDLNFYGSRHLFLPRSIAVLEDLLKALKENPSVEIEIRGHVCCTQETEDGYDMDAQNNHLSVNRAKVVYDYLVRNGIALSRLSYKGFGGSLKLYPSEANDAEEEANRRVELKIVRR